MKKNVFLIVAALGVIWLASSMSYSQQTIIPELQILLQNQPLKGLLSKIEIHYWGEVISIESIGYFKFVEFLIRKGTHFFGYGIIGVIFYFFYVKLNLRFAPLIAIATVFILGSLDEYRQYHTPGRTGIFNDVVLDTAGAVVLVGITYIIRRFIKRRRNVKYKQKK